MYKYERLMTQISDDIVKLPDGARVPSRNFLSKKHSISRATVDKIFSHMQSEGLVYTVKGSGTFVAHGRLSTLRDVSGSWGVIIPNVVSDVYPDMVRGIEDVASQNGLNLIICNTDNDLHKESEYINRLSAVGVSGIVIVPAIAKAAVQEGYRVLIDKKIPFVFCNRGIDWIPQAPLVCSNGFCGAYMATRALIENGYEKIGFIAYKRYRTSIDRYYGYVAAMMGSDLELNQRFILNQTKDETIGGVCDFVSELLALQDRPDAFCCYNDMTAGKVYRAIIEAGLRVSDDIGLIGFDNSDICEMMDTKLTTIEFKKYEIGKKAAELLLKLSSGEKQEGSNIFVFQPELVIRDSCRGAKREMHLMTI